MLLKFAELLHNILGSQISPLSDMNFQKNLKSFKCIRAEHFWKYFEANDVEGSTMKPKEPKF